MQLGTFQGSKGWPDRGWGLEKSLGRLPRPSKSLSNGLGSLAHGLCELTMLPKLLCLGLLIG